ncbi:MAG: xylulokinase [Halanaerobiales bacterium]|nr:xylulokinase [Halanaerobiales bacterium]
MENIFIMGVDIGTSGSKGVIISSDGKVKAEDYIEHDLSMPQPGWAEHDAERVWWGDFKVLLKHLAEKSNLKPRQITAIGISALCPDLLLVDKDDVCLRPAILYGIDTRAKEQVKEMNSIFGEDYLFRLTGNSLSAQSLLPKLMWLRDNEPENLKKAEKMLTASSFIVFKLTGSYCMDYLSASVGGLVDIKKYEWATDLFKEMNLSPELLPELGWATDIAGKISSKASQETGLKEGVPVIIGTCDVAAEAVSAGVLEPGETILVYGSTMSYLQCLNRPILHRGLFSGLYCISNCFFSGGATATAGSLTKWFRDNFSPLEKAVEKQIGINAYELLDDEVNKLASGPSGLLVLPFFSGARSPINDEEAKGVIAGLTLSHNRTHIYKALLEGIGYEIKHNFEVMKEAGVAPEKIIAVGGGIKGTVWPQIISDVLGKEQYCLEQSSGAPLGAAFLAGLGTGIIPDRSLIKEKWIKIGRVVKPSLSTHNVYQKYYQMYRSFYEKTKNCIHQLGKD